MKKYLISAALMIFLIPFCFVTTRADLIYMPLEDDFYAAHSDKCVYEDRYYTVVAEGGASGYRSPEDLREVTFVKTLEELYISYVYKADNGVRYGLHETLFADNGELLPEPKRSSCWIRMDQLFESYSGERFMEEYASGIRSESWSFSPETLESLNGKNVWLYAYPGGDGIRETAFRDDFFKREGLEGLFTDPYGNTWAYLGNLRIRDGKREAIWILLDDPARKPEELYKTQRFRPDSRTWPEITELPSDLSLWKYAGLAVGIPLAVTTAATALFFLFIKRKSNKKK